VLPHAQQVKPLVSRTYVDTVVVGELMTLRLLFALRVLLCSCCRFLSFIGRALRRVVFGCFSFSCATRIGFVLNLFNGISIIVAVTGFIVIRQNGSSPL
jgi:hypothetical protein